MATALQKLVEKYSGGSGAAAAGGSNGASGAKGSGYSNRAQQNEEEKKSQVASLFTDDEENEEKLSAQQALDNLIANSKGENAIFEKDVSGYYKTMICAVEQLVNNKEWNISMDMNGDGSFENVALADAIASSFDSELDLFIFEKVNEAIDKYGSCSKGYLGQEAQAWLKEKYNIVVDAVGAEDGSNTNRTYAFTMLDENGNVVQDANGKKGSYIFSDCLIPDGYAQGAEVNLSSILDQMGYDCISKADFLGKEDEYMNLMQTIEQRLANGEYGSANGGSELLYGNRKNISDAIKQLWSGSGSAPGQGGLFAGEGSEEAKKLAEKLSEEERKQLQEEVKAEQQVQEAFDKYKQAEIKDAIEKKQNAYQKEHGVFKTFEYDDLSVEEQNEIEKTALSKIKSEFSNFDFSKFE